MNDNLYILPKRPRIKEKVKAPDQRKFSVIPLSVINVNMTKASYKVLIVLSSYCNKAGFSHVSLKRIANDIGISTPAVSRQVKRLERLGIVKKVSGHYPQIKGATRRIIYDNNLSDQDAGRIANAPVEPYNNREISAEYLKKKVNHINTLHTVDKPLEVKQSIQSNKQIITSLLMSVSTESELHRMTMCIESGLPLSDLRAHINKGFSILDYKGYTGV